MISLSLTLAVTTLNRAWTVHGRHGGMAMKKDVVTLRILSKLYRA